MMKERILTYRAISELRPDPRNPRKHSRQQINALARSIKSFGFNAPVLTDEHGRMIAGHGRLEAARKLGINRVPVIVLDDLTEAQAQAYLLADNKLADRSDWDETLLAIHLKELSQIALDFEIEDTGFETPEIDLLIHGLDDADDKDEVDDFQQAEGPAVTKPGDIWVLGDHRIYCGNSLESSAYTFLLGDEKASAVFTDPPYNVRVSDISGLGRVKHREFAMASGEMSQAQFADFLTKAFSHCKSRSIEGALIYVCSDWRHLAEMEAARSANALEMLNLCVWAKSNGGMGSLYRSRHELVFVFRNGDAPHRNNVQLGRFGRNRTNVWNYPGATSFTKSEQQDDWQAHPTVKPVRLVADAILDSTARSSIVLDIFAGSGTTILAAERTGRRARTLELDPLYVDTAVRRWQAMTGREALRQDGSTFNSCIGLSASDE